MGLSPTHMLPQLNQRDALRTWGAPLCPQHPVGVQGAWLAPRCMPDPAQSAMGTNSLHCSALLCPQDLHAVEESRSPRTHHRHRSDTRSSSRAPNMQGNTSLGMGLWMLLLQLRWSLPMAQDGRTPGLAGTPASHTSPLPHSPGCRHAPAAHTSLACIQATLAHTHTEHLLTLQHARRAGARLHVCWAGKAAPFGSRQRRGSSPRPHFTWYLGGCSQGEVGQAPCQGG